MVHVVLILCLVTFGTITPSISVAKKASAVAVIGGGAALVGNLAYYLHVKNKLGKTESVLEKLVLRKKLEKAKKRLLAFGLVTGAGTAGLVWAHRAALSTNPEVRGEPKKPLVQAGPEPDSVGPQPEPPLTQQSPGPDSVSPKPPKQLPSVQQTLEDFDYTRLDLTPSVPLSDSLVAIRMPNSYVRLTELLETASFGCSDEIVLNLPSNVGGVAVLIISGKRRLMFVLNNNHYVVVDPEKNNEIDTINWRYLASFYIMAWYKNPHAARLSAVAPK